MSKKWLIMGIITCSLLIGCNKQSTINPEDYVTLGQYKGLEVIRLSTEVTDVDVKNKLENDVYAVINAEEVTDRTDVKKGDIVNIDFEGKHNGKVFEGGSAKGYELTIGSGMFIEGFEEGLIGKKVGDKVELPLTFPEFYPNDESLAGEPVVFSVTINKISKEPEITDEIVKKATEGKYSSVDDYKAAIEDELEASAAQYADSAMYIDLWKQAVDNATIKSELPEEYLNKKIDKMRENAETIAKSYNIDFNTYLTQWMNMTEDEFNAQLNEYSTTAAKEGLVLQAIAKAENIEVSEEEFNSAIEEYVGLYQYGSEEEFRNSVDIEDFKEYILQSKVQEFLADQAVIKLEE